jgi:hypothetical protein
MKPIAAVLLVLACFLTIHFANGATTPDRPAGVDASTGFPSATKWGSL